MYAQPKVDDPNIVIPPIRNTAIPTGKKRPPMDQNICSTILDSFLVQIIDPRDRTKFFIPIFEPNFDPNYDSTFWSKLLVWIIGPFLVHFLVQILAYIIGPKFFVKNKCQIQFFFLENPFMGLS